MSAAPKGEPKAAPDLQKLLAAAREAYEVIDAMEERANRAGFPQLFAAGDLLREALPQWAGVAVLGVQMLEQPDQALTGIARLGDLVRPWNQHDLVPKAQEDEAVAIGKVLFAAGGEDLMRRAYHAARSVNPRASYLNLLWDGIGQWRA